MVKKAQTSSKEEKLNKGTQNPSNEEKFDFKKGIAELEEINRWFQNPDIDLDEGLEKLRKGKDLIEKCQARLTQAENEFEKIRDDLDGGVGESDMEGN